MRLTDKTFVNIRAKNLQGKLQKAWVAAVDFRDNLTSSGKLEWQPLLNFIAGFSRGELRIERDVVQEIRVYNRTLRESFYQPAIFKGIPWTYSASRFISDRGLLTRDVAKHLFFNYLCKGTIYSTGLSYYKEFKTLQDITVTPGAIEKDWFAVVGWIPFKVYTHFKTHTTIFSISQSSRLGLYFRDLYFMVDDNYEREQAEWVKRILDMNITPEEKGNLMPATRMVYFFMAGWSTPFTWQHFFDLRVNRSAQKETREIAIAIQNIFSKKGKHVLCPNSY